CQAAIYSNEYADYIIEVRGDLQGLLEIYEDLCYENLKELLGVVHIPRTNDLPGLWEAYRSFPKCYGLLDTSNLEATGVERMRRQPFLDLYGQGVIVGVIDTGIDYTHPVFRYADGTSRILELWDQTIPYTEGKREFDPSYGTVYTREQINTALASSSPYEIVPSRDTDGHGTFLAGVAAGNEMEEDDISGIAPLADLAVVKLKEAKPYLREYYQIAEDVPCYQETDLILAVYYLTNLAIRQSKPLVILMALGTNQGGHDGMSYLASLLRQNHQASDRCVCLAAGNELGWGHHYHGQMSGSETMQELEFRVGEGEEGFSMEMWGEVLDTYSVGFTTPTGYTTGKISVRPGRIERINFTFEPVTLELAYGIVFRNIGTRLTGIRFINPTPGLWKMQVCREEVIGGEYDIWMPMFNFLSEDTHFMKPDPDILVCDPGNVLETITTAAYNHRNGSIYLHSSRGYARNHTIKPDLAAPGVGISGPVAGGGYDSRSGTSVSAAQTAGVAALLMEYAPGISGREIQQYLIRGATRTNLIYPNREWGYGTLDIYRALELIGGQRR
ncbi:MAG: S8 family peptidase, partial [Lachnospiraceae bacterium]|nr:S8 family peptidase [Lachnospiraceae bacterium]